jgi:hypothetical protein
MPNSYIQMFEKIYFPYLATYICTLLFYYTNLRAKMSQYPFSFKVNLNSRQD